MYSLVTYTQSDWNRRLKCNTLLQNFSSFIRVTLNVFPQMLLLTAQAPAPLQAGIPLWTVTMLRESSLIFLSLWSLAGRSSNSAGPSLRAWSINGWAKVYYSLCFCVFVGRDELWTFLITIIVTKIIPVISIIAVLFKCAENVQRVLLHITLKK